MSRVKEVILIIAIILMIQTPIAVSSYNTKMGVVDVIKNDGRFTILVKALKTTELEEFLKGEGEFTIFAPTDESFKKLPSGMLKDILKSNNKHILADLLSYHISNIEVNFEDIKVLNGTELNMINGKKTTVMIKAEELYINNAKIIINDIEAENGIIHVIDYIIIP